MVIARYLFLRLRSHLLWRSYGTSGALHEGAALPAKYGMMLSSLDFGLRANFNSRNLFYRCRRNAMP